MNFGTFMEFGCKNGLPTPKAFSQSFSHARLAESLGMDTIWLAEHHFEPDRSVISAQLIIASILAAKTNRIKIGTAIHVLPLGHPLRIAEEVATLDHLASGRLLFGIGRSAMPGDFNSYNIPLDESRARFSEYLEVILGVWKTERFSYRGNFYNFDNINLVPKPFQTPHPPIRIAAGSPDTYELIGQLGFPIFAALRQTGITAVTQFVKSYKKAWKGMGHPGHPDVYLRVPIYVAKTDEQAIQEAEQSFMAQYRRLGTLISDSAESKGADLVNQRIDRGSGLTSVTWPEAMKEKVIVGSPETVRRRLSQMSDALCLNGVAAELNAGELLSEAQVNESLRLLCQEVLPHFR